MLTITPATKEDVAHVADLLEELDRFYGGEEFPPLDERVAIIQDMLFRDQPAAYVLLARDGEAVVGLAAYSFLWPAVGITQSLYLKELYVRQTHRRQSIGRLLMEQLYSIAWANQCSRVEWTTDSYNEEAQRFYASLGVPISDGKVFYRVQQ